MMNKNIRAAIAGVIPEITALRHELHEHPEIRFEEQWTSDRVARFLDEAGIPHTRGHAKGTGIVARIEGATGKTVALRADMDALELEEKTGLPYASKTANRMHACGHDGHMACLCGAAKVLSQNRDALAGTVKLLFQPAEELGAGGLCMVHEGVLDGVDAVFALHAWPTIPVGCIGVKSGPMMAGADFFRIDIQGRGCHGARPADGIDPVMVAAHIVLALQTIVSREIEALDPAVVSVCSIHAGAASNIIPDSAHIEGTFRTLNPATRDAVACAIERIAQGTAQALRATAAVQFGDACYVPLHNAPSMTEFARKAIAAALGPDAVVELERPSMGAEDFAFYLQKTPGALVLLGIAASPDKPHPPLHSPHFDFNDAAIGTALSTLVGLSADFLRQPPASA